MRYRKQVRRYQQKDSSGSTEEIKEDLHFNSISGGTDINGCFACGAPTLPVYAGEIQAPGLRDESERL